MSNRPKTAAPAAPGGRRIDLDAARRARAEQRGDPPVVVVGGKEYELPAELPGEVVTSFGLVVRGDVSALDSAIGSLFGDKFGEIKAVGLSWEDEKYLLESVLEEYGFELPESSASGAS
jgi:hypothetical protein